MKATAERRSDHAALDGFQAALLADDAAELYDRAPCGYLSTAPDGTITKVNQTLLTLTGFERADLVGRRRFAELLTPGGRIYHETHYAPLLLMHGEAREIALEIVAADGTRLPVLVNSVLERDAAGAPVVVRTAVFDATERRAYERELLLAKQRAEESEERAKVLAVTLQETLIPPSPPDIEGLDVGASYRPAGTGAEIGGDFYDIFEIAEADWVVAIGDVCGKGVEAATITALARYTIRAAAVRHANPADALETLHRVLWGTQTSRFCSAALTRLRRSASGWHATVALGGHPQPLLVRPGTAPRRVGTPGRLLGITATGRSHDAEVELGPGDVLVLYTDGIPEGRRGREFYGEERLLAAIEQHHGSAQSLTDDIVADVVAFQGGLPRDDIAVVALRVP
ncbi:MAG: rsbP 3 [Acidimicrobiales bacterium]|nr:rsbP 3 [Acidimicrobiales bacterium]